MKYKELSDSELFEVRRRIIFLGIDHLGNPSGEQESMEIMDIMQGRILVTPEAISAYGKGLRKLEVATSLIEMRLACLFFQVAIMRSPKFMNAYANLTGVFVDMKNYKEAIETGNLGRLNGFFFDLEYNRCKAMLLLGHHPSEYKQELLDLINVIEKCVHQAEAIQKINRKWKDERRFATGIVNQCRQVGYLSGMNDLKRNDLDDGNYTVDSARRAVKIVKCQ